MTRDASVLGARFRALALGLISSASLVGTVAACGIRTPPRPPEDTMPHAATDLSAKRDGTTVKLDWSRPDKSMDGQRLADLTGFLIERRAGTDAFTIIADLPADAQHRIRKIQRYSYVDEAPPPGAIEYRVVCYASDGQRGPPSASAFTETGGATE